MRPCAGLFGVAVLVAFASSVLAEVHYVDLNSTNAVPPYTNWTTAATTIQDAVDAASAGDEVVVTDGIYATGGRLTSDGEMNRVSVDKPLAVRSVKGPQLTTIRGGGVLHEARCVYLINGASLTGFTLSSAKIFGNGGGVFCESQAAVLSNCVVSGNSAFYEGGGAYGGTLNNCTLTENSTRQTSYNTADSSSGGGAAYCTLNNCNLIGNSANANSGGHGGGAAYCTLNNCVLIGNSAVPDSYSVCRYWCETGGMPFCCGGYESVPIPAYGGGAYSCTLNNCIVFSNTATVGSDYYACGLRSCWTADPLFVDTNGWANLRLQSNSPCINAGNNAYAPAGPDLDGNPRVAGGTVDIGAYEFQAPVSMISYAWLQQYGLPINSSTDTADPDGDGVDNYHEWLAGTDPTNPFSSPAQLTITPSGAPPTGVILTWSTNAVGFILQSTTNLFSPAAWVTNSAASVVVNGQNTVTNPISGAQQFYRLSQ